MTEDEDILHPFKTINNKLNKKFMRRLRSKVEIRQNDVPYLEKVVSRMIKIKDYTGVLDVCSKIIEAVYQLCSGRPFGVHKDIIRKYEFTFIVLVLILEPNPRKRSMTFFKSNPKIPKNFLNMLEKYTTEDSFDSSLKSISTEKLISLVESLIMNCRINNSENIRSVEKELIHHMSAEELDELRMVINWFTNQNEPIEQFTVLANNCEKNELPQYAGLCLSAKVNCELSRKDYVDDAFASIKNGDQFVRAHRDANELACYSPSDEYLQAALTSNTRSRTFYKNSPLEESLNWKIVAATSHVLDEDHRPEESLSWLRSKVEIRQNDVPYLEKVVSRMIKIKDYTGVLDVCSKIIEAVYQLCSGRPFGVHKDIIRKYEFTFIVLVLILEPNPRKRSMTFFKSNPKIPKNFLNMLEKYTTEDSFDSSLKSISTEKLISLVESLIMNCRINNSENIRSVEKELIHHMSAEELDELRMVINWFV